MKNTFKKIEHLKNFVRKPYTTNIRIGNRGDKFANVYTDSFGHHNDIHNHRVRKLRQIDDDPQRFFQQDNITSYFINVKYKIPKVRLYDSDEDFNYSKFLDEFNSHAVHYESHVNKHILGSNRVRYIIGDVGTGKSTFLRRLMADLEALNEKSDSLKNIVVHINCENILNTRSQPTPITGAFYVEIFKIMLDCAIGILPEIQTTDIYQNFNPAFPDNNIKELCAKVLERNYRFTLILDNLDFYHYYYSRYAFFVEYRDRQEESIKDNLNDLIIHFTRGTFLGLSGLNVLIPLREVVWEDLSSVTPGIETHTEDNRAIRLIPRSDDEVIGSRITLFKDACEILKKDRSLDCTELDWSISAIETYFRRGQKKKNSPIDFIFKLGQQGHRSLVEFFNSLALSPYEFELIERLIVDQSEILINLYINKMQCKYSQKANHFPNLFLVDCRAFYDPEFSLAHEPHIHTYWLKYIILSLVYKNPKIRYGEIHEMLSDGEHGYEAHLIRHATGSLCTTNEFRCLEAEEISYNININDIKLRSTKRGDCLMEMSHGVPFCFSYRYLSSITNDFWLSFPEPVAKLIYQPDIHFQHLYLPGESYAEEAATFVLKRAQSVAICLRIIHEAWKYELGTYRRQILENISDNINPPDLESSLNSLTASVQSILSAFKGYRKKPENAQQEQRFYELLQDQNGEVQSAAEKIKIYFESPTPFNE